MPPKPSKYCRKGHLKSGKNVITHRRGDKIVKECRTCANARYRALRTARKRNTKLLNLIPKDFGKLDIPDDLPPFNCDPETSAFSEETIKLLKEEVARKRNAEMLAGKE